MNTQIIIIILSLTYISYYVFAKFCLKYYTVNQIVSNVYLLCIIFSIILFNNDILKPINNINTNYLWIVFVSIIIFINIIFVFYGCNSKINFGIIDGIAIAIYLPVVTIIGHLYFNSKITYTNLIGIFLIAIGAYLVNL